MCGGVSSMPFHPSERGFSLRGDGAPQSPNGLATYSMEPDHYTGRATYILFRPDARVLKQFVPPPLELSEDPVALLKLYELKRHRVGQPYKDPRFCQYNEAVISTVAYLQGQPGHYNLYMWVDRDWAMWKAREVLGFPKKLADIHLTKLFPDEALDFEGREGKHNETIIGSVSRYGYPLIRVEVQLTGQASPEGLPRIKYFYGRRLLPSPQEGGQTIHQLIRVSVENVKMGPMLEGRASLELFDAPDEELACLKPREVLRAYNFTVEWVLPGYPGEIIHDYQRVGSEPVRK